MILLFVTSRFLARGLGWRVVAGLFLLGLLVILGRWRSRAAALLAAAWLAWGRPVTFSLGRFGRDLFARPALALDGPAIRPHPALDPLARARLLPLPRPG